MKPGLIKINCYLELNNKQFQDNMLQGRKNDLSVYKNIIYANILPIKMQISLHVDIYKWRLNGSDDYRLA